MRKETYGEVLVKRLHSLDFSLSLEKMMSGLYSGLPKRMEREKAVRYYTDKLKRYWRER